MFDAWILPSRVVDSNRKVPDLNCEVQDLLLEVVDLKYEVTDLRSGGIPPPSNLTPGANETAEQHLQLLRSATFVSFSKLYYAQFEVVSHKIFWRGCFARLAPPAAPEGKLPRSLSYAIGLGVTRQP